MNWRNKVEHRSTEIRCSATTVASKAQSQPPRAVMLIGEGSSNRDVAERLTLSIRTVESHIYRAMHKTGTTSREELAALLRRPSTRAE